MPQKRVALPLGVKYEAPTYEATQAKRSGLFTGENLVNMFAEKADGAAIAPFILRSAPGFKEFSSIGGGDLRGAQRFGDIQLQVIGETLYVVDANGVGTPVDGTVEGTARVRMDWNRTQVGICSDSRSYIYVPATNVLSQILDTDLVRAVDFTTLNSYGLFLEEDSDTIQYTSLADFSSVDGLDFFTAEGTPDKLKAIRAVAGEVVAWGEDTIEFFVDTGDTSTNVFQRTSGAQSIDVGCLCRDSVAKLDNTACWLGREESGGVVVYKLEGHAPRRISNHAVEDWLEAAGPTNLANALGISYMQGGHLFYGLTIPGHGSRFYNVTQGGLWQQRVMGNWPMRTPHAPAGDWGGTVYSQSADGSKRLIGRSNGKMYSLELGLNTQDGNPIVREVTCPPFYLGGASFTVDEIELIVQTGVGLDDGSDYVNPNVQMSISVDGGKTWSDPVAEDLGEMGDYGLALRFFAPGWCEGKKGLQVRFRCDAPVEFAIMGAFITYTVG